MALEKLDTKGLRLAEINLHYPRKYQTLGYDFLLDVDGMNKPKAISSFQLAVNNVLTLLFMKPGQYPSLPEIGIDIEQYLHEYSSDKTIPKKILKEIQEQCTILSLAGLSVDCSIDTTEDGIPVLLVSLSGDEMIGAESKKMNVVIGISYDKLNRLYSKTYYV